MKRWRKGTWMQLKSSDLLRALMNQQRVSQGKLARFAGCSQSFVSQLLNPETSRKKSCSAPLAEKIADALNVPSELLFTPSDSTDGRSVPRHKGSGPKPKIAA
jgi:transcriptional regulator with XRE-family HTH domain